VGVHSHSLNVEGAHIRAKLKVTLGTIVLAYLQTAGKSIDSREYTIGVNHQILLVVLEIPLPSKIFWPTRRSRHQDV
jgi:hypothetical protein